MSSSVICAVASGFLAAPLVMILLHIRFGDAGATTSDWIDAGLVAAGTLVAVAAHASKRLRRFRRRPTVILPDCFNDRMRRDIGLDNL